MGLISFIDMVLIIFCMIVHQSFRECLPILGKDCMVTNLKTIIQSALFPSVRANILSKVFNVKHSLSLISVVLHVLQFARVFFNVKWGKKGYWHVVKNMAMLGGLWVAEHIFT